MTQAQRDATARLRKDPAYKLKENRENALRSGMRRYWQRPTQLKKTELRKKRYQDQTINGSRAGQPWTPEEICYLIHRFRTMTYLEIGKVLGRSWIAINRQCEKLGLSKNLKWRGVPDATK